MLCYISRANFFPKNGARYTYKLGNAYFSIDIAGC